MFTSLYFYRVPKKNVEAFLTVQKKAALIYKKHGAIDDWTFAPDNLSAKYGCSSFLQEIPLNADEELYFSLSLFQTKEDHDRVMLLVDSDPGIEQLFQEVFGLIDLSRVVRGEFNRVV